MLWAASRRLVPAVPRQRISRRCLSTTARRGIWSLSVAVDPSISKQRVLDAVRDAANSARKTKSARTRNKVEKISDSAVVLASASLASWLGDGAFLSALLSASAPSGDSPSLELSVLSAAVDGIPWPSTARPGTSASSTTGLSILHGDSKSLLPGLWDHTDAPSAPSEFRQSPGGDLARHPAVKLSLPSLLPSSNSTLEATIPLTNTLFHNSRPFTMFASRWQRQQPGSTLQLTQRKDNLETQLISFLPQPPSSATAALDSRPKTTTTTTLLTTPLIPITQPRKIVAGLGNIIRQFQVDGKPSPASAELESILPALLRTRSARSPPDDDTQPGPMGVWALVIPADLAASTELPRCLLGDDGATTESSEWEMAAQASVKIATLLRSGGRLQRILSGGGGWGLKQGLLSLDPETRYSPPDEEDVESFMRSFRGEVSADDVITPGSYVQFFVEPTGTCTHPSETAATAAPTPCNTGLTAVVGTCETSGEEQAASVEQGGVRVAVDWFGALSSRGIFLSSYTPEGDVGKERGFSTKVDVPNCTVMYKYA